MSALRVGKHVAELMKPQNLTAHVNHCEIVAAGVFHFRLRANLLTDLVVLAVSARIAWILNAGTPSRQT